MPPPAHHHDVHDEEAREQERGYQRRRPVHAEQPVGVAPFALMVVVAGDEKSVGERK